MAKKPAIIAITIGIVALLLIANFTFDLRITSLYPLQLSQQDSSSQMNDDSKCITNSNTTFKQILLWNSPHRIEASAFGIGYQAFLSNRCKYKHCIVLTNATTANLSEIDALVINMHELWLTTLPNFTRQSFQRFVFFTQESPSTMPINPHDFTNYFNWTMSYRQDSDIRLLYGRLKPKPGAPTSVEKARKLITNETINYAANKTKIVAWFASHCGTASQREKYVAELQKYIQVDVYGGCGNLTCRRNNADWLSYPECYDMLENDYKFYLSFENSLCQDYITEKFFSILQRKVVPVVYGGANYSKVAPQHSYIDANGISPKLLAEYLLNLNANDSLYNDYFWWKDYYEVEAGVEQMSRHAFCDLCQKLHTDFTSKVYGTMATQWDHETQCVKPKNNF